MSGFLDSLRPVALNSWRIIIGFTFFNFLNWISPLKFAAVNVIFLTHSLQPIVYLKSHLLWLCTYLGRVFAVVISVRNTSRYFPYSPTLECASELRWGSKTIPALQNNFIRSMTLKNAKNQERFKKSSLSHFLTFFSIFQRDLAKCPGDIPWGMGDWSFELKELFSVATTTRHF